MDDCKNEDRYYGSDLNKFINKNCTKKMTAINIDLLLFRRTKRRLRIIESKHTNEPMKKGQKEVLRKIAWIFKYVKNATGLDLGVYIVTGNQPYNEIDVEDLILKIMKVN